MKIHLQKIRWERDYSIEQLARISGVSSAQISRIENGLTVPTIETLCKLARALGCNICELFDCD